jgi:DNA repair exonuclease SbcCD ATPase subunit
MSDWGVWAIGMMAVGLVVSGWLWRRAEGRAARLMQERDRLESRRSELEASLDRSDKARKRQAEELATFRRKADKSRKRESRTAVLPLGTAARVQDLEAALARSERDRLRAESECERLAQERVRLEGLLAKQEATLDVGERSSTVAGASAQSPVEEAPAEELESRLEATRAVDRERIVELEAALASRERDGARMKKRIANQEQLYAALRAELALKKDRLRAREEQIERLQALQVALVD